MIFNCEMVETAIQWPYEKVWPQYCPLCGSAVHSVMSSHHEMVARVEDIEYTNPPSRIIEDDVQVERNKMKIAFLDAQVTTCRICAAEVADATKHEEWHRLVRENPSGVYHF